MTYVIFFTWPPIYVPHCFFKIWSTLLGIPIVNQHGSCLYCESKIKIPWPIQIIYVELFFFFKSIVNFKLWYEKAKEFVQRISSSQCIGLGFKHHMYLFHFKLTPSFNQKKIKQERIEHVCNIWNPKRSKKFNLLEKTFWTLCKKYKNTKEQKNHQG